MSPEKRNSFISIQAARLLDDIPDPLKTAAIVEALKILVPRSEVMTDNTKIRYADNFEEVYQLAINNEYIPLLVANHQAHPDGLGLAKLTDELTKQSQGAINGFWLPVAGSIFTGHQGPIIQTVVESAQPFLAQRHLQLTPLNRKKDIDVFGLPPNKLAFTKKLRSEVRSNSGLVILPEGSVHSAETNPETGAMFGMQPFEQGAIEYMIQIIEWEKKKALLIPASIHGGSLIINADTRKPTKEAYRAVFPFGKADFIGIYVDTPILVDKLILEENQTITMVMEDVINSNLPIEAQRK